MDNQREQQDKTHILFPRARFTRVGIPRRRARRGHWTNRAGSRTIRACLVLTKRRPKPPFRTLVCTVSRRSRPGTTRFISSAFRSEVASTTAKSFRIGTTLSYRFCTSKEDRGRRRSRECDGSCHVAAFCSFPRRRFTVVGSVPTWMARS